MRCMWPRKRENVRVAPSSSHVAYTYVQRRPQHQSPAGVQDADRRRYCSVLRYCGGVVCELPVPDAHVTTYATGRRHRRQRILENVYTTWCSACGCVWSCGNVIGFNGMWMSHFLPHSRLCLLRWRRLAHCPVTANGNHHAVHSTAPLLAVRSTLISSSVPVTTPSPSSPTASIPALPMPLLHHHHGRG
jgi:hypothetical protein